MFAGYPHACRPRRSLQSIHRSFVIHWARSNSAESYHQSICHGQPSRQCSILSTSTSSACQCSRWFACLVDVSDTSFQLQHHLYAPVGPHRDNLLTYQRTVHDFFIAEDIRQELQRKIDATLQVMISMRYQASATNFPLMHLPSDSSLPPAVEHFHSLVPLDTNAQKTNHTYGYKTWVYKATSSKDGNAYVLRRIEGRSIILN